MASGKRILSNFIRHANTHNRIKEEQMMWEQREKELSREDILPGWSERMARRASPLVRGRLVSDVGSSGEKFNSDSVQSDSHSSYYWTRQLMKAEESDPYRWGHAGYKEQHPEEFISSSDEPSEATPPKKLKRKTANRDKSDTPPPKKQKRSKKSKADKKSSRRHKKKHKKDVISPKKFKHKRHKERTFSSSQSSDS